MTVKIVTDTLSDIPDDVANKLGITLIPLTVSFGHESFLDRIEITSEEFYERLVREETIPTTTQPSPLTFANAYKNLAEESDEILVITLSGKLSGTYQSALNAKNSVNGICRIEVMDSQKIIMSFGLAVIAAAKMANAGAGIDEIITRTNARLENSQLVAYFDTLKYLAKGGRVGKAQGFVGSLLSVKPILTIKDGEMAPLTRVRSKAAGIDYLCNAVAATDNIESVGVEYCTTPEDAELLIERISSIVPRENIYKSIVCPVVGTYSGPGGLAVSIMQKPL
ncbi:MAG: DegV family protein [Dehalococcoidales bacterium]|jgi:DegV family protein with EDD domain|nr:DegV family protein [Dehalococcoidales bacterium]MDD3994322.1 DegV family protein [Dehalococcoidales bacterium]NLT27721.1 DegV family protein [Dehalococcoidales bacterium]